MIGVPRYWRSTTLPAGHVWANGDLALFADWPELKKIYDAGGFAGMLLAYNANSATIAANLGKWRPNAANPTGLYVPNLSEQFFRGWTQGAGREAGSAQGDAARNISANAPYLSTNQIGAQAEGAFSWHTLIGPLTLITYETEASGGLSFESSRVVPTAEENRPVNVALPVCIYLGLPA